MSLPLFGIRSSRRFACHCPYLESGCQGDSPVIALIRSQIDKAICLSLPLFVVRLSRRFACHCPYLESGRHGDSHVIALIWSQIDKAIVLSLPLFVVRSSRRFAILFKHNQILYVVYRGIHMIYILQYFDGTFKT